MKKNIILTLFALLAIIMLSGCVTRLGDFTVISTKNIDWSKASNFKRHTAEVEGQDIAHIIVFIPTKFAINIEEAVDEAIETVPGAVALTDAVIRHKFWYIPYIYGQEGYVIEGTPLIDTSRVTEKDLEGFYLSYIDEDGEQVCQVVSEKEFNEVKSLMEDA